MDCVWMEIKCPLLAPESDAHLACSLPWWSFFIIWKIQTCPWPWSSTINRGIRALWSRKALWRSWGLSSSMSYIYSSSFLLVLPGGTKKWKVRMSPGEKKKSSILLSNQKWQLLKKASLFQILPSISSCMTLDKWLGHFKQHISSCIKWWLKLSCGTKKKRDNLCSILTMMVGIW